METFNIRIDNNIFTEMMENYIRECGWIPEDVEVSPEFEVVVPVVVSHKADCACKRCERERIRLAA